MSQESGGGSSGVSGVSGVEGGSGFEALLVVQDHDTSLDQLRYKRGALPQRIALAAAEADLSAITARLVSTDAERSTIDSRRATLDIEVTGLSKREQDLDRRMRSGDVTATRELTAMVEQVDALRRRRSTLEDEELQLMVDLEPLDSGLALMQVESASMDDQVKVLRADLGAAEAEIDEQLAGQVSARSDAAAVVPEALLGRYEQMRVRLGGVGAARIVGSSCGGCHLAFSATELDRIRHEPPDALITCDQCGRIVVR